jgi:hypothetical protein
VKHAGALLDLPADTDSSVYGFVIITLSFMLIILAVCPLFNLITLVFSGATGDSSSRTAY